MTLEKQQNGMVLGIVLIFLLILSLLAVSALSTNYLQIRMSGNFGDEMRLLQAAEVGLRAGENKLIVGNYQLEFAGITVSYSVEQLADTRCVIDESNNKHIGHYYRITSRAGWSGQAEVVLQSTYVTPGEQACDSNNPIKAGRMSWRQLN